MAYLAVSLGDDRDLCGQLSLLDDAGNLIVGPFAVAGRSSSALAALRGNPSRDSRLRYGDTPTGDYRLLALHRMEAASLEFEARFGEHGVIVFEPTAGQAALAEANGRHRVWIHAGSPGPGGMLRSTGGALRLAATDMGELVRALAETPVSLMRCQRSDPPANATKVFDDDACADVDPPSADLASNRTQSRFAPIPRRGLLKGGAAFTGVTFSGPASFIAFEAGLAGRALAQTAYNAPSVPQPSSQQPMDSQTQDSAGQPAPEDPLSQIPPSHRH